MEIINLHDEAQNRRSELSYYFLLKAVSMIDPDFSSNISELQVELKINSKEIPIIQMLIEYEKAYDDCVREKAEELINEKADHLKEIILDSIEELFKEVK